MESELECKRGYIGCLGQQKQRQLMEGSAGWALASAILVSLGATF